MTEEAKHNLSDALKGRIFSPEHCHNISIQRKKYYETHTAVLSRPVVCLNTGEVFVNATAAHQKYTSADTSAIHENCKRKHYSCGKDKGGTPLVWAYEEDYINYTQEHIQELLYNVGFTVRSKSFSKRVICLTTNTTFNSIKDAACFYGISVSNLNGCLKGRQKTAGKDKNNKPLEWAYCG